MSKLAELQQRLNVQLGLSNESATKHTQSAIADMDGLNQFGEKHLQNIEMRMISPNPHQPRIAFNEEALDQLANNIKELGLLQPITVRKAGFNRYEIISGERRFRACQKLDMTSIDCLVVAISDEDNALLALAENITRDDLEDYEIAKAIISFQKNFPNKKEYAQVLNIGRAKLYRLLSFKMLPQSVLQKLDKQPGLMPDYVAQQIKTLVNDGYDITQIEPYIHKALDLIEQGSLKHSKISSFIQAGLQNVQKSQTDTGAQKKSLVRKDGSKFGSIKQDGKNLTIQIKLSEIDEDKRHALEEYLSQIMQ